MTKREACAQRLFEYDYPPGGSALNWHHVDKFVHVTYLEKVDAIFAELAEPDEAMRLAGLLAVKKGDYFDCPNAFIQRWKAGLAATNMTKDQVRSAAGGGDG